MTLKVLTYNIHKGFGTLGFNYTLEQLKKNIAQAGVDICFLQEVVGRKEDLKTGQIENQFEYIADTIWPYFSYGKNASYPKGDHGNAILSSLPIVNENNLSLTMNPYEHRGLLHIQVEHPKTHKHIHLLNTHLNLRGKDRIKQMEYIHEYIEKNISPEDIVIFCGDFNDWNQNLHQYIKKHQLMTEVHDSLDIEIPKTFPSFFPVMRLDRIYTKNIDVISATALVGGSWSKLSDHIPILAEFRI